MKDFIIDHPIATIIITGYICDTVIRLTKLLVKPVKVTIVAKKKDGEHSGRYPWNEEVKKEEV